MSIQWSNFTLYKGQRIALATTAHDVLTPGTVTDVDQLSVTVRFDASWDVKQIVPRSQITYLINI